MSDPTHKREPKYLLRRFEQTVLPKIAAALPSWVVPDHLTSLGLASCLLVGTCFVLSNYHPFLVLLTIPLWVLNWLGDSLDGTLARVRHIERPHYGYYLDHVVDMFSAAAVCIGIGLSPYMSLGTAILWLVLYYLMSINVFLETSVLRTFQYGYGYIGPTEVRVLFVVLAIGFYCGLDKPINLLGLSALPGDIVGGCSSLFMVTTLLSRIIKNLEFLGKLDPPNVVKNFPDQTSARASDLRSSQNTSSK